MFRYIIGIGIGALAMDYFVNQRHKAANVPKIAGVFTHAAPTAGRTLNEPASVLDFRPRYATPAGYYEVSYDGKPTHVNYYFDN